MNVRLFLAAAALAAGVPATAAPAEEAEALARPVGIPEAGASQGVPEDGLPAATLTADELAEHRGGYTVIINDQTLIGIVQGGNFNGDYVAGLVSFDNNAFANFNGLLALGINTGLQSNVIAGMSVTINVND